MRKSPRTAKIQKKKQNMEVFISGSAYCRGYIWSVVSPISKLNRFSTMISLLPHSVEKNTIRLQLDRKIESHIKYNRV